MTTFKYSRHLLLGFAITTLIGLGFDASDLSGAEQIFFGLAAIFLILWLTAGAIDAVIRIKNRIQKKLAERNEDEY